MEDSEFEGNGRLLREKVDDLLKAKGYSIGSDGRTASGCKGKLFITVTERPRQGLRYWSLEALVGMNPVTLKANFYAGRQPYVQVTSGRELLADLVRMDWYDFDEQGQPKPQKIYRPQTSAVA